QSSVHPRGAAAGAAQGAGVRAGARSRRRQRRPVADSHRAGASARGGEGGRPTPLRVRPGPDAPHRPTRAGILAESRGECAQGPGGTGPRGAHPDVTARWPADPAHIAQVVERLRAGAVIAFPTDTLYGVGATPRILREGAIPAAELIRG